MSFDTKTDVEQWTQTQDKTTYVTIKWNICESVFTFFLDFAFFLSILWLPMVIVPTSSFNAVLKEIT